MNAIFEKSSELVESFEKLSQFMTVKNRKTDYFNESLALDATLSKEVELLLKRKRNKKVNLKLDLEGAGLQIDKNRTGNVRGAGLGLAIVQYLVTAHGGAIKVKSDLGQRTVFSFTLLLVNVDSKAGQ